MTKKKANKKVETESSEAKETLKAESKKDIDLESQLEEAQKSAKANWEKLLYTTKANNSQRWM